MSRTLALAAVLALAGCPASQRHPAITAGVVGGVVGFTGCEFDGVPHGTCAIIGASTAAFLGGITALITYFLDTGDHSLVVPPGEEGQPPPGTVRARPRDVAPPLALPDAGVPADAPAVTIDAAAAPVDAPPADAP
ncbi:MAG TPA: hypothetical protein VLX92_02785 [Kofleriaceae bacterium]|nr:hypothetical protein [Kofleriaceae bacterium]